MSRARKKKPNKARASLRGKASITTLRERIGKIETLRYVEPEASVSGIFAGRQHDVMTASVAKLAIAYRDVVAKAAEVFGTMELAEAWMSKPAIGLDGLRPVDLLSTPEGAELVKDFLGRLEYNVYT